MLQILDKLYPVRYTAMGLAVLTLLVCLALVLVNGFGAGWAVWPVMLAAGLLTAVGARDLTQPFSAVRRNYPILGNIRYLVEFVRPEIRQYLLEGDNERLPFSPAQRSLE